MNAAFGDPSQTGFEFLVICLLVDQKSNCKIRCLNYLFPLIVLFSLKTVQVELLPPPHPSTLKKYLLSRIQFHVILRMPVHNMRVNI